MFLDSLFKFPRQVHLYKSAQFRRLNQEEKLAPREDFMDPITLELEPFTTTVRSSD